MLSVGWGDDEAVQLAEVLPLCTSATVLNLYNNKISDRGAKALAAAFAEGAMPKLEELLLHQQPDWRRGRGGPRGGGWEGRAAEGPPRDWRRGRGGPAEAFGKGALPKLETQIGDEGAVALSGRNSTSNEQPGQQGRGFSDGKGRERTRGRRSRPRGAG